MQLKKVFIFLFVFFAFGFAQNVKFKHLTVDQGLAQNSILSIYQDSLGFMWFGTKDGLSKYDGYSFSNLTRHPESPHILAHNHILAFHETERYLFIGTLGLLNRLDKRSGNISEINISEVCSFVQDASGLLWMGSYTTGLYALDTKTDSIYRYTHNPADSTSISDNHILSLHIDRANRLWVGTRFGGLCRTSLDKRRVHFTRFLHDSTDLNSISGNTITAICEDSGGGLWFATKENGLNLLTEKDTFKHFFYVTNTKKKSPESKIRAMLYDADRNAIWIGTPNSGLYLLPLAKETKYRPINFRHRPETLYIVSDNSINCMFKDRSGILWIGTNNGGVNKLCYETDILKKHRIRTQGTSPAGTNHIWSFYQDNSDAIWIGTSSGVSRFFPNRPEARAYINYDLTGSIKPFTEFQVRAISRAGRNRLWLAILGVGLGNFNYQTKQLTVYKPESKITDTYYYYAMLDDGDTIWLGETGSGLQRFDKKQKKSIP